MTNDPTRRPIRLDKEPERPAPNSSPYVGQSAPFGDIPHAPHDQNAAWQGEWHSAPPAAPPAAADAGTRKVVAALLAILLGSLGLHKFYLGYTGAGLIMLLVNVGGWFISTILSVVTLGVGALFLFPLMGFVSTAIAFIGLVEGILYLSKSDAEFYRTYLAGRKEWF